MGSAGRMGVDLGWWPSPLVCPWNNPILYIQVPESQVAPEPDVCRATAGVIPVASGYETPANHINGSSPGPYALHISTDIRDTDSLTRQDLRVVMRWRRSQTFTGHRSSHVINSGHLSSRVHRSN